MKKYLVLTKNPKMHIRTWAELEKYEVEDVVYNYLQEEEVDEAKLRKILMTACFYQYDDEFEDEFGINPNSCELDDLINIAKDSLNDDLVGVVDMDTEKTLYFNPGTQNEFSLFDSLDDDSFVEFALSNDVEDVVTYMLLEDDCEYDFKRSLEDSFKRNINQLPNSGVTENGKKVLLERLLEIVDRYDYFHWEKNDELTFGDIKAFADNPYEAQKGDAFERYEQSCNPDFGHICIDLHDMDDEGACLLSWLLYLLYKEPVADFLQNIHSWDQVPGYFYDCDLDEAIPALIYLNDRGFIDIPEAKLEEFGEYPWE